MKTVVEPKSGSRLALTVVSQVVSHSSEPRGTYSCSYHNGNYLYAMCVAFYEELVEKPAPSYQASAALCVECMQNGWNLETDKRKT